MNAFKFQVEWKEILRNTWENIKSGTIKKYLVDIQTCEYKKKLLSRIFKRYPIQDIKTFDDYIKISFEKFEVILSRQGDIKFLVDSYQKTIFSKDFKKTITQNDVIKTARDSMIFYSYYSHSKRCVYYSSTKGKLARIEHFIKLIYGNSKIVKIKNIDSFKHFETYVLLTE